MGKGKRLKSKRKRKESGRGILSEFSQRFTENFQRELRASELWDQMVEEIWEKRAEQILRECKAEVKPGLLPDESRRRPEDFS
ncbi:MAG TPA: hypothetical protein ENI15_17760 [Spirochaetes bacterium]|nr:hypothetical protein [Spirochaetota bacterium]